MKASETGYECYLIVNGTEVSGAVYPTRYAARKEAKRTGGRVRSVIRDRGGKWMPKSK